MIWIRLAPLAKVQIIGGGYLRSEDGRFVIFAKRYRLGDPGYKSYRVGFWTVEYLDGATYRTGGKNRTLYDGSSLDKAKAAAEPKAASRRITRTR